MELREHHCLGDEIDLLPDFGPDGVADDPLNAWIPRDATFEERNVSVLCSLLNSPLSVKLFHSFSREATVLYAAERWGLTWKLLHFVFG